MELTEEQAEEIAARIFKKVMRKFKQEFRGENEELLDRVVRQYHASVARSSWKASQKWCKWNQDEPVLMPDYARMYYRKKNTEVLVLEYPPQIRLMKFKGALIYKDDAASQIDERSYNEVCHYSLALPYVVFIFKFVDGVFVDVRCAFSDRPLKRLDEKPMRPYLSNIDNSLSVCLGQSFLRDELIKDNIVQQVAYVLSHFWQTIYSDEWSQLFWNYKKHFVDIDPRMTTMLAWQEASVENPLFVVEDVRWMPHHEDSFGDIVARLFEDDNGNYQLREDLHSDLTKNFLEEVVNTINKNIDTAEQRMGGIIIDQLASLLMDKLDLEKQGF